MSAFVKSASTSVSVANSKAALEKMLRRYGCSGFGSMMDYERMLAQITFRVPDSAEKDAPLVPVRLEINVRTVYDALYGRPTRYGQENGEWGQHFNPKGYIPAKLEQAERVAWRQVVLWVDAACSAALSGVQRMSEAFFAHTLIRTERGSVRVVDHLDSLSGGDAQGWRALLAPPDAL